MTQTTGTTGRLLRLAVGVLGPLVVLAAAMPAAAEVRLENAVKKVDTFVNAEGEVERRLVDADSVVPGDELRYVISFENSGQEPVDAGSIVITNPIPENTEYLEGTAFGSGTRILFSVDGEAFAGPETLVVGDGGAAVAAAAKDYQVIRWVFEPSLAAGATGHVSFNVRLK